MTNISNTKKILTFVINLPDATVRREQIVGHLKHIHHLTVNILDAIRGASLNLEELALRYSDDQAFSIYGHSMSKGEIGCALSHIKAYELLHDSNEPYALILEDDAQLNVDAVNVIANDLLLSWLNSPNPRVVILTKLDAFLQRGGLTLESRYRLVRVRNAWLSHGYLINRSAAARIRNFNYPVKTVADHWVEFSESCHIDIRGVDPYCIGLHTTSLDNYIESTRYSKNCGYSFYGYLRLYAKKLKRRLLNQFFFEPIYGFGSHDEHD